MRTAIVGINWGDEGKGRMVDLLCEQYDIVIRYQGGNNAGHTVVNDRGKFVLNLLPSGILRPDTVNVMGPGMVIDLEHLSKEIASLREKGVQITPENLKISDRATICLPYHKLLDNLEEDRLADKKFGSTRRGIAPVYADKYMKKALRMGDLLTMSATKKRLVDLVEWKNLVVEDAYHADAIHTDEVMAWLEQYGLPLVDHLCNVTSYLTEAAAAGRSMMFEAQLGALRDIDYGIYPYTTSSSTIAAYAPIGAGIPSQRIEQVLGIMKAYSSCVGEGPFVSEFFGDEAHWLRESGGEYGAATGRPRRVGAFDVVASRYGTATQGATSIALTKLDVLSGMTQIPVCVAYEIDGQRTLEFPQGERLNQAKPLCEYLPGWTEPISHCRTFEELPQAAQDYVKYIEQAVGCKIQYVSVGPGREEYIECK